MRTSYKKICYLIAAAGIKEDELFDFVSNLEDSGPSKFAKDVAFARKNIFNPLQDNIQDHLFFEDKVETYRPEIEDRVVKLLVIEAGLSKSLAAELLAKMIHEEHPNIKLAKLGKRSIIEWLRTVQQQVTPSELLHIATIIRNQYVHKSTSDWELKTPRK